MSRLDRNFKMTMSTNQTKLGTVILQKIHSCYSNNTSSATQIQIAEATMVNDKWNPECHTLNEFAHDFSSNVLTLNTKSQPPSPQTLRAYWIQLLPHIFKDLKTQLNKDNLQQPWSTASEVSDLVAATAHEISACRLQIPSKKTKKLDEKSPNPRSNTSTPSAPTPPERVRISDEHRYAFAAEYANSKAYSGFIRRLQLDGKTREQVVTQEKPKFTGPGCFVCHIKDTHSAHHTNTTCNILKYIFPYSFHSPCSIPPPHTQVIRQAHSYKDALTNTSQPPPSTTKLCYDTGTVPDTIASNKALFTSYNPYECPSHIILGDDDTSIPALGLGIIDIVVNNQYLNALQYSLPKHQPYFFWPQNTPNTKTVMPRSTISRSMSISPASILQSMHLNISNAQSAQE